MHHASRGSSRGPAARAALSLALVLSFAAGCGSGPGSEAPDYSGYLFMTDTYSGKVFTYDPATRAGSASSIAATGKNGTGEIAFHGGIGYASVGSGTDEGLYRFDPSAANPSFTRIGGAVAAQYVAFYGAAKAYVSTYGNGIYAFDPSSPSSGFSASPIAGTSGLTIQELVVTGGYLYAADNGNGKVLRIDPADDSLKATIAATKAGTTGLVAGSYDGVPGIFVANTGGYDSVTYAPLPGSVDFIPAGAADGGTATSVADTAGSASIYPARLVQLGDGNLMATGYGHTYRITLTGSTALAVELLAGTASFGSLDMACKDGLVYVPSTATSDWISFVNELYVFDASGVQTAYSPVTVMPLATASVSNIAFYED